MREIRFTKELGSFIDEHQIGILDNKRQDRKTKVIVHNGTLHSVHIDGMHVRGIVEDTNGYLLFLPISQIKCKYPGESL